MLDSPSTQKRRRSSLSILQPSSSEIPAAKRTRQSHYTPAEGASHFVSQIAWTPKGLIGELMGLFRRPSQQRPTDKRLRTVPNGHATPTSLPKGASSLIATHPQGSLALLEEADRQRSRPSLSPPGGVVDLTTASDDGEDAPQAGPSRLPATTSTRPGFPIATSTPMLFDEGALAPRRITRQPSRPDLSSHKKLGRRYEWMHGGGGPAVEAPPSPRRVPSKTAFGSRMKQKSQTLAAQRALEKLGQDPQGDHKSIQSVLRMFNIERARSRKAEKQHQINVQKGNDSRTLFEQQLQAEPARTLDAQLKKTPPVGPSKYRPEIVHRTSVKAQEDGRRQRSGEIEKILSRIRLEEADEERKIRERLTPRPPKALKQDQQALVKTSMANRAFFKQLSGYEVNFDSLQRLRPNSWLNDELINYYGTLIQQREDAQGKRKIHYFSSFFYPKLEQGYEKSNLKRWTKKVDIFEKDVVVFAINYRQIHWTAACINFERKRFEFYDSMGDTSGSRKQIFRVSSGNIERWKGKLTEQNLRAYLDAEHRQKKGAPFDLAGWKDAWSDETPQQDNGSDCGVFSCQTIDALARGRDLVGDDFDFDAGSMPVLRNMMVYEIATGKLMERWPK